MPWPKGKPCSEETKAKLSKKLRPYPEEAKKKISEKLKGRIVSEETRRKIAERHTGMKLSDETKKKISDSKRGKPLSLSKEVREKLSKSRMGNKNSLGFHPSEETRKKLSAARKGHPVSEETRAKIRAANKGSKCYNWKGGKSFEPYCPAFNMAIKERVRDAFGRRCYLCGIEETRERHHAHHVDYNKSQGCNGRQWGLVPLCRSCHSKTQHNRWHWFALLRDYWIYEYLDFNSNLF